MNTEQVPVLPFLAVYLESLAVEGWNAGGGGLAVHGRQQHHRHQQQQQHAERTRKVVRGAWQYTALRQATAPPPPTAATAS